MSFSDFQQWFEINPIVLMGGIAAGFTGGMLPISTLLGSASFDAGLLAAEIFDDPYFAHFKPLPGSSIARNENGKYPFANQVVASNAIIVHPQTVSLLMTATARGYDSYATKYAIMGGLKQALAQHSAQGGWYTVAIPVCLQTGALLLDLHDVTPQDYGQPQVIWQWDFEVPLISQQQAQQAQSQLMAKIGSGTQVLPDQNGNINWSGVSNSTGQPNSSVTSSVVPGSGSQGVFGGAGSPPALYGG